MGIRKEIDLSQMNMRGKLVDWVNSVGCKIPFTYDDVSGELTVDKYKNDIVTIRYLDSTISLSTTNLRNCGLGFLLGKKQHGFRTKVFDVIKDNTRNLVVVDQKIIPERVAETHHRKFIKVLCHTCGYISDYIAEQYFIGKQKLGCSCCSGRTTVEGINDIPTTASWMVKYFQGGYNEAKLYTKKSNQKIYPICPYCGRVKDYPMAIATIHELQSIGCKCSDAISYPEKFMNSVLTQLKIEYIWGYRPDWLRRQKTNEKGLEFDFCIPKFRLIIEMDGGLGHGNTAKGSRAINPDESRLRDIYKDRCAHINDFYVVRINSLQSNVEYMSKSIMSKLNNILCLDCVDWNLCNKKATNNLAKEVCEYYNTHPGTTRNEMKLLFNLSNSGIGTYLRRGYELGWCSPVRIRNGKIVFFQHIKSGHSKRTAIYRNGVLLGEYESATELSRNSINDFGIELNNNYISDRAKNGGKYKGYEFKYI